MGECIPPTENYLLTVTSVIIDSWQPSVLNRYCVIVVLFIYTLIFMQSLTFSMGLSWPVTNYISLCRVLSRII